MEEALVAYLLGQAALSSAVGSRIRWVERPQASALPAIVLTRIDGQRGYTMSGPDGLVSSRIQIDCWAKTFAQAKTLARAVIAALSGMRGTHRDIQFGGSFLDDEADSQDEAGAGQMISRTRLDFIIWHSES